MSKKSRESSTSTDSQDPEKRAEYERQLEIKGYTL